MPTVYAGHWGPEALIDSAGNAQANATLTLYDADGITLSTRWTDRYKTTPTTNPWTADVRGTASLFAEPGTHWLVATIASVSVTYSITVPIDPAEESGRDTAFAALASNATNVADVVAAIQAVFGSGQVPASPPSPPTNLLAANNNGQVTLTWAPGAGATTQLVTRNGVTVDDQVLGTANTWVDPIIQSPASITYGMRGVNTAGQSAEITQVIVIAAPAVPGAVGSFAGVPNVGVLGAKPHLTWVKSAGATGYSIDLAGTPIDLIADGNVEQWTDTVVRATGSYLYGITPTNSAGPGPRSTFTVIVPNTAAAITVTDKGTVEHAANGGGTIVVTARGDCYFDESIAKPVSISPATPWTPAAGSTIIVFAQQYQPDGALSFTISDTFGGTGGGTWVKLGSVLADQSPGDYYLNEIWARRIGTSPSSGNVAISVSNNQTSYWKALCSVIEATNVAAQMPFRANAATAKTATASDQATLGYTPRTDSLVVTSVIERTSDWHTPTMPAGYTSSHNGCLTGSSGYGAAYKAGGSPGASTDWTTLDSLANGVLTVELAAADAGTTIDSATFTPVEGDVLVALGGLYMSDGTLTGSATDTFGDTGGSAWAPLASGLASLSAGDNQFVGIWSRTVGASPAAGHVTLTRSPGLPAWWYGALSTSVVENAAGPEALHYGVTTGASATDTADLTVAPDAASVVFAACMSQGAAGALGLPAGFTSLHNAIPTFALATFAAAYDIASSTQTQAFTSCGTVNNVAVSVELGQTVGGGTGLVPPSAPTGISYQLVALAGGVSRVDFTGAAIPGSDGFDVWENEALPYTPVESDAYQIGWPAWTGPLVYSDPTPRAPGTYHYYFAGFNAAGVGAKTRVDVVVSPASGSSLQPYLGVSAESLTQPPDGWADGTNVQTFMTRTGATQLKWCLTWSLHTVSAYQQQVTNWVFYSDAPGKPLYGLTPVFTISPGMGDYSNASVLAGSHNAEIDAFATTLQGYVASGKLVAPILRCGHEFTLPSFAWGITNSQASMDNYRNAQIYQMARIHLICPTARLAICGYTPPNPIYDYSSAIPWSWTDSTGVRTLDFVGTDIYDDWQGSGSAKPDANMYSTYNDPAAAWQGRWYGNTSQQNPGAGTDAWLWNLAIAHGVPFTFAEWAVMARQSFPYAGGGDDPYFIQQIAALIATGHVAWAIYFDAGAHDDDGGLQDHIIWDGNFPNALAAFEAAFNS